MSKVILNFNESGNLGKDGRYFTIACVETENTKPIKNTMRKSILKTKKTFSKYSNHNEIKATHANPVIKDYFYRRISSKNIKVRYIVADLNFVKPELIRDENLLYNYMLQFIIIPVARRKGIDHIEINIDKRTIKVQSENSFRDYIMIKLQYELGLNMEVSINYYESHNFYAIQAADFVANA